MVVAVDGVSMESWAQALLDPTVSRPHWRFGQTVTYSVLRDGTPVDVPVTLGSYPLDAIWQEDWSTIVFALVFALIALYIVLRRPTESAPLVLLLSAAGILGGTTWSFGLQVSNLVGGVGFWLYVVTTGVVYLLFYIAALHFALIFPRSYPFLARHSWLIGALYVDTLCALAGLGGRDALWDVHHPRVAGKLGRGSERDCRRAARGVGRGGDLGLPRPSRRRDAHEGPLDGFRRVALWDRGPASVGYPRSHSGTLR